MDACNLLLRRPWQYDREVIHDGRKNAYSFKLNKKTITLAPQTTSQTPSKEPTRKILFLNSTQLEKVFQKHKPLIALLIAETNQERKQPEFHSKVHHLLDEFTDVFPQELPRGLPPLRGIEHHIDLDLGVPLPNRPTYWCNPKKSKELQRQVEELISIGFVRESMKPCSVPALLVPKKDGTYPMCIDSWAIN
ncbi:hypothetical protein Pint_31611 [Pistacia integerrima]|uniref:Uncharacterized protein n=1 Tax=Pistacia integerrima TaxID=434235 RepID=A0ACC0XSC1_9ROSI|nr:hypothetical protein Pint_31611 [Pistacia integerrima]